MELGKQIKRYRSELGMSQDTLAERIYVSRQTVSNWENDKNYPDINSLLRLSEVFHISIDILIRGDVEKMKKEIRQEDRQQFEKTANVFAVLFFAVILTPVPLFYFLEYAGAVIWAVLAGAGLWMACRIEKKKKEFDIQTYKEIVAFGEGKMLDEITKAREEGKRPYQKLLLAAGSALITVAAALLMGWMLYM